MQAEAGRYPDAIVALNKLIEIRPNFGPGWASLGLCEFETKNYANSLSHLRRASELGFAEIPSMEKTATYHLALLLNLNGDFENAWELLASKFGKGMLAAQTKTALGLALLLAALFLFLFRLPEPIALPALETVVRPEGHWGTPKI